MVGEVRLPVQQDHTGHRGLRDNPLHKIRRILLKGAERLTDRQLPGLEAGWDAGAPHAEVHDAWAAEEHLRDVHAAPPLSDTRIALEDLYTWTPGSTCQTNRLARTVRR